MLDNILKRRVRLRRLRDVGLGREHSTVAAANAGLDMEMEVANGQYFAAPDEGRRAGRQVSKSRLDDMVTRIVRTMFRVGIFDHPAAPEPQAFAADVCSARGHRPGETIAEQEPCCSRIEGRLLPIGNREDIAVIGPAGGPAGAEHVYKAVAARTPRGWLTSRRGQPAPGHPQRALANGDLVTYADGTVPAAARPRRRRPTWRSCSRGLAGQRGRRPLDAGFVVRQLRLRRAARRSRSTRTA